MCFTPHCGSRCLRCAFVSIHMPSMMSYVWACVVGPRFVSLLFISHFYLFSFTVYLFSVLHNFHNVVTAEGWKTIAHPQNEECCSLAIYHLPTGYEPNVLDDFRCSETTAMIFQDESGDIDTEPSYSCDAELDDEIIGKALSSPLFIQEREEPANRRQAYHSHEESFVASSVLFRTHKYGGDPYTNLVRAKNENEVAKRKTERIRISLWKTKRTNSRWSHNWDPFQADSDRRSIQEWNGIIESQRRENWSYSCRWWTTPTRSTTSSWTIIRTKIGIFVKLISKSLHDMEELKRFQGSTFDEFSISRLIENQDTIHELTSRIQELQNEVNWKNDSRDSTRVTPTFFEILAEC